MEPYGAECFETNDVYDSNGYRHGLNESYGADPVQGYSINVQCGRRTLGRPHGPNLGNPIPRKKKNGRSQKKCEKFNKQIIRVTKAKERKQHENQQKITMSV